MGTKALLEIKLGTEKVYGISKFDGDELIDVLKQIGEMDIDIEDLLAIARLNLKKPMKLTLDEVSMMFKEFSESQKALDEVWKEELGERYSEMNLNPMFQWNAVYPSLSLNVVDVFKATSLKPFGFSGLGGMPILDLTDDEVNKMKENSSYVYYIDLEKNNWRVESDALEDGRIEEDLIKY